MNLDRIAGRLESLAKYCSNASEQLRLAEKQDFWQATDFERLYLPGVKLACFAPECEASLQNKADLHIHTRASDGDEIERVIERALSLKLDAIAITDHDCLDGAIEARRKVHDEGLPLAIIPGIEVSSAEGHIGALFVNKPVPKGLSAKETIAQIHKQRGIAIAHHPFVPAILEMLCGKRLAIGHEFLKHDFDGVEVTNAVPGYGSRYNMKTRELVKESGCNMAFTGGSDAHHASQVGKGLTYYPGNKGLASLYNSLKLGLTLGAEAYWTTSEKFAYYTRLLGRMIVKPIPTRPALEPTYDWI